MKSTHFSEAGKKENPHGVDVKMMYNDPSAQALLISLQPGQSLKPHTTPVDVFFFVFEGTATVHIGEETESFTAGTLIESPKDIVHFLSNQSDNMVRVLVVKAPKP
ncbi:MAG: cupin domain-containing protein [Bacteroidales bacterium]|jgi:quercetin dioxygenase-like cupin family protein|nr:cupin domain-containing protein [Bacteroidales bacterium]